MDRNTVVAFVLILLVMILMPMYWEMINPPETEQDRTSVVDTSDQTDPADTLRRTTVSENRTAPETPERTQAKPEPELTQAMEQSDTIVVETEDYWMAVTNRGGGTFTSIKLKNYPGPHGEPYAELIPERQRNGVLQFSTIGFEGDTVSYADNVFNITVDGYKELPDTLKITSPLSVSFSYNTSEGGTLTRTLTFFPDQYHIGMTVSLEHFRDIIANRRYTMTWNSGIAITENNARDDLQYSKAYSLLGDELVDIDAAKADAREPETESFEGTTRWVAVRNKYFASIITPISRDAIGMHLTGTKQKRGDLDLENYDAGIIMPYSETATQRDSFFVYMGPLDYNVLNGYDRDFQRMMNFGWTIIRPISKGVLWAFTTMHKYIANYGLVLILFGVFVKILVFPLTKKSYVSMKEMQNLQPKVKELREKYKDDSQKMNQEMMKIYKEHGVNPMGGCLPMLFQMPLLYALFIVFRTTIELRGAEFIWWITDLSQPDTIFTLPFSLPLYGANVNVLPIVMGVTMIFQQRMTSGASTQQQKMMMWFMPVVFLLIFNNFPSGLNLYYALFNVMTIIQQKWFIDVPSAAPAKTE
ncbi:MAG: membrane protein insertase YidC [Candidatus Marinimicrobia bacterium]|nr:membrane protein insertase YidC [Candidatus Neomarinimicrobiota bacterium]MCF7829119.1 membrane protein insertase YidC [Candidatus Neomarinimicrobiota bacterium]MCF7881482.1 membrane protein insertase YidC [Candidatus Neomarinimicrobiota bacterium]